jgi:hypothetical protein
LNLLFRTTSPFSSSRFSQGTLFWSIIIGCIVYKYRVPFTCLLANIAIATAPHTLFLPP